MNIKDLIHATKLGDGLACYILGRCYFSGELDQNVDYQKFFNYFEYGANTLKDPRCMYYDYFIMILKMMNQNEL